MKIKKTITSGLNSSGLTVLELLIVMSALAIVVLISVPGSAAVLSNYRIKSTSNDLINSLNAARFESLKRHSVVRVCPSSNGRFCLDDGDWSRGWLIYTDGNADTVVQDIELLESYSAPNNNIRIIADGAVQTSASFNVSGLQPDHDHQQGDFRVCYLGSRVESRQILVGEDGWVELVPLSERGCSGVF